MVQGKKPLAGEPITEKIDSRLMNAEIDRELEKAKRDPIEAIKTGQMIRMGDQYKEKFKTEVGDIIEIRSVTKYEADKAVLKSWQSIANTDAFKMIYPKIQQEQLIKFKLTVQDSLIFSDAALEESAWLIYYSIKDFYVDENKPQYSIDDVKKFDAFRELAIRVRKISGLAGDTAKSVKSFLGDDKSK